MPKEQINWPQPAEVNTAGSGEPDAIEILPPGPRLQLHWDARHGTVQVSMDIDWDVLQRYVDYRRSNPDGYTGEDEGLMPNRATFYTEGLDRADLQRLVKQTRRARDAAFGADE